MDNSILVTVLSIVLSGVLATFITIIYRIIESEATAKQHVFLTAVSFRYMVSDEANVKALNSIEVVFHKNMNVRLAWKAYMEEADHPPNNPQRINDKYIKLLEVMAKACRYKNINWDDLRKHYYPNGLFNKKLEDGVLRKLQIEAAQKNVDAAGTQQNTPQNEQFANQMMLQLLAELIENPDTLSKLIEFVDKSKKKQ